MRRLGWYVGRLRRMSGPELLHRGATAIEHLAERSGWIHRGEFPTARPDCEGAFAITGPVAIDARPYIDRARAIIAGRYRIFDVEHCTNGAPPNWNRDAVSGRQAPSVHSLAIDVNDFARIGDIKYVWEPNRHHHLVTLAQAYALTGERHYVEQIVRQLESWLEQCPYRRGVNWSSGLELGIRLINWSFVWQLIGGARSELFADEPGRRFRDRWLRSVYLHVATIMRSLSRYSSANNHLIGELAGVCVAAAAWPCWSQMATWGERARRMLQQQALLQIASDGGAREQTTGYTQFVFDFLLIAGLAARRAGTDFDPVYWQRLQRVGDFIASLMSVSNSVPMLGDADDGYVVRLDPSADANEFTSLLATCAVLFERGDLAHKVRYCDDRTRWLLGGAGQQKFARLVADATAPFVPLRALRDSGYFVLGERFETAEEVRAIVDCGSLGYLSIAAHGHADALALMLSIAGEEILLDPGTFLYHGQPAWRAYFRSTRAHNTVMVDGMDQAEQTGPFMWGPPMRASLLEFDTVAGVQRFCGEHDGYRRLPDPVTHRREICFDPRESTLVVRDTLYCAARHRITRHWHFAESLAVQSRGPVGVAQGARKIVVVEPMEAPHRAVLVQGGDASGGGWVSRRYAQRTPSATLAWESDISGTTTLTTKIHWRLGDVVGET